MNDKSDKATARMFFALWPDGLTRSALDRAAAKLHRRCGGRATRAQTIHLTLAFLGEVPISRIAELIAASDGIAVPAFVLNLSRLGWWRHNRIAWATAEAVPEALIRLVGQLREKLENAGFAFDRKAYVPHVTLLRKAHCPEEAFPPLEVEWSVREFVLVRSVTSAEGAAYEIIGRWELQR